MFLYVLIGIAAFLLLLLLVVALQPSDFRVARNVRIAAPATAIFPLVNDHHSWEKWSPWAKLDTEMKETYEGPASGVGAIHTWSGNNKVGEGKSTILESQPHERILLKLEFIRPWQAKNDVEFTFQPNGNETVVTWSMTGRNNFMGKAFGLIMNMDRMVGTDFERGLSALKSVVETGTHA